MPDDLAGLHDLLDDRPQMALADPKLMEAGGAILTTFWQAGCEAWGTMLNRGVLYTSGSVDYNEPSALFPAGLGECLITAVQWRGDRNGVLTLVIPVLGAKGVVSYWMSLMAGTEPNPEAQALDDEGMDAYTEGLNQFLGSASQALRQNPGGSIDLKIRETRKVDFLASAPAVEFGNDFILCGAGQFTIEGMSPVSVHAILDPVLTGVDIAIPETRGGGAEEEGGETATGGGKGDERLYVERILPIHVPIHVNLAERKMRLSEIMELVPGSIVEFKKSSEEPLDLCVGRIVVGRGEAVIVEEHFGLQISEIRYNRNL